MQPPESATPPKWASDYFHDAPAGQMGRGLVGHVPIVATLLIIQGFLEMALALFCLGFALLTTVLPAEAFGGMHPRVMAVLMGVIGATGLVCGSLRIAAGVFNWSYRRRTLGMIALGIGLAAVFTGYCAPTAIGLAIYGLIVYVNESVAAAFELGKQGRTKGEIQAAFPADM
jgi:hypothetical protein